MTRALPHLLTAALLALLLWPLAWPRGQDDFPLSPFPMFASGGGPAVSIWHVLGVDRDGRATPLPSALVASHSALQTMATLQGVVAQGAPAAQAFCAQTAARVRAAGLAPPPVELLVAVSRFDVVAYFDRRPEPLERHVHARCPVQAP